MTQKPIILGLTGSIGMGKSTTAAIFEKNGVPIWDADAAVRRLYSAKGRGTRALSELVPKAIDDHGVNKSKLKKLISKDTTLLPKIESVIHPLVADDRQRFLTTQQHAKFVLLDIPLLFENEMQSEMDYVIVVSVDGETQKKRVMERGTMSAETFEMILSKQMPDEQKREKADFVVETTTHEAAKDQVEQILRELNKRYA